MNGSLAAVIATSFALLAVPAFIAGGISRIEAPAPPPDSLAATAYDIDSVHSSLIFRVKHLDAAWFYGRFNKVSGWFDIDDADLSKATIAVEVAADSIDSNDEGRDKHLKSQDFFSVKQFPTITLKSRSVKKAGAGYDVEGDLTLLGVSKPVDMKVEKTGEGKVSDRAGYRVGYEVVFTIKRTDFGMKYGTSDKSLGDEVRITAAIEGTPAK